MNVLAFDTCYATLSVAVGRGTGDTVEAVWSERIRIETGHAEALMPLIERGMREAGMAYADLDRIVVTRGPGTFTGVRTGVAAARALALATRARLIGVSSLWAIARLARPHLREIDPGCDVILVAMDARKAEVHLQAFDFEGHPLDEPHLASLDAAALAMPGRRLHVVGSGAALLAPVLAASERRYVLVLDYDAPEAHHRISEAVAILPAATGSVDAGSLRPLYLRPPDAKPQSGKSLPWVTT